MKRSTETIIDAGTIVIEKETGGGPFLRLKILLPLAALAALVGCTPAQQATAVKAASTPAGALFCSFQLSGGGSMIANLIDTAATAAVGAAASPASGVLMALATNAAKADVDTACASAAASVAGATSGVPVSPPAAGGSVPVIAVKLPNGLPTITVTATPAA